MQLAQVANSGCYYKERFNILTKTIYHTHKIAEPGGIRHSQLANSETSYRSPGR
jgi:hypothetical protein